MHGIAYSQWLKLELAARSLSPKSSGIGRCPTGNAADCRLASPHPRSVASPGNGIEADTGGPQHFEQELAAEIERVAKVVKSAGIKIE